MKTLNFAFVSLLVSGCATVWVGPPATVNLEKKTVTDKAGLTLYTFNKDAPNAGRSACNGPCLKMWHPLSASQFDRPTEEWTTVVRDDGTYQWAYKGKPLYHWANDHKPGDHGGEGVNGAWAAARP